VTCKPVRALRSIGESLLPIAVILFALLGCSDRAIPPSPASKPAALSGQSGPAFVQVPVAEIRAAIEACVINGPDPALGVLTRQEQVELKELYEREDYVPLWVDAAGRLSDSAHDALALLSRAADEGLDPADYGQGQLDRLTATLESESPLRLLDLASFDVALSSGMLRYLHHVHSGRVDAHTIGLGLSVPADHHDFATLLRSAVADHRMAETVAGLRPPLEQYGALRTMLTRYRSLAADATREALPPFAAVVHPGEPYAGLNVLYRQLVALGDLPVGTPAPAEPTVYEGTLVEGVKRFQVRHGLETDGVLGKRTQAALRIPLAWRVRQIELALERLRWLPHLGGERVVAINIPMFRLWAWDSTPSKETPSLGMGVIVGRALSTQTPVFVEHMREVIFRPYWNVPRSIARNEILPILERDPDYLRRQNMEIVRGPGDDAQAVAGTPENVALLRQGALRVRQRPGPQNSLGLVKFVFPNQEDVYMHGTPAPELFSRSRRDFSHGCVRVEDPVALAEWALEDQPEWTRDRILSAMAGTQPLHVKLLRPIPVILFYTTTVVMPEDGTIHFAEDIYLHDARLDRALARAHSAE
jgi:murein L,D-transpeptidase YcbB/YkuD